MFRPSVRDLEFHLFSRPVHPELFETAALRVVRKDDYEITVRITQCGHVLTFHSPDFWLTEATTVRNQELPRGGRLLKHRFNGAGVQPFHPGPRVSYQMTTQVEELSDEVFEKAQAEIVAGGSKGGLLHRFDINNRLFLTPVSHLSVQAALGILTITAFHTFPGENAIVKTISLIERG